MFDENLKLLKLITVVITPFLVFVVDALTYFSGELIIRWLKICTHASSTI